MRPILNFIHSLLDRFLFLILAPINLGLFFLISIFYKKKAKNIPKVKLKDENRILFLASGKPIKYPGFEDKNYYNMWHEAFQKQLRLPCFSSTYIFYENAQTKDIYRLTSKVIAIAQPILKSHLLLPKVQTLFTSLKSYIFLSYLIKRIHPRIIYTNAPGNNLLMSTFLSYFYEIELVAQVMGSYDLASFEDSLQKDPLISLFHRNLNKIILSIFFRQTALVLSYNKYCGDFAIHNGAHPAKVRNLRITPPYYDKEDLNILSKEKLNYPKTEKNIILWSRFSSEKKNIFAIKGALEALKIDHSLGLILVGYGPLSETVKKLVDISDVAERVTLHAFKPFHELMSLIHHSQIALLPLGGYALVEAALMKKPIVCFDLEWHQELLSDSAYIVDYPDSKQIKVVILEALSNPKEAQKRAQSTYMKAKSMFCPIKIQNREYQVINDFLRKN